MSSSEQPHFDDIFTHLEIEAVTRELSILDEAMDECNRNNRFRAAALFESSKTELLNNPKAYLLKQAETARLTWLHQPTLAKYMYQENEND